MKLNDRVVGILGAVGSVYLMTTLTGKPYQVVTFPFIILGLLLICSIMLVVRKRPEGSGNYKIKRPKEVFGTVALILAYILLLSPIGYILDTILFILAFTWMHHYEAKPIVKIVFAVAFTLITYAIFGVMFHVKLPTILL